MSAQPPIIGPSNSGQPSQYQLFKGSMPMFLGSQAAFSSAGASAGAGASSAPSPDAKMGGDRTVARETTQQPPPHLSLIFANAQKGLPEAQFDLGLACETGWGGLLDVDYCKAVYWYQQAAEKGERRAQFFLASLSQRGLGFEKPNIDLAIYFYTLAAEQNFPQAQWILGLHYFHPLNIDYPKARYWLAKLLTNNETDPELKVRAKRCFKEILQIEKASKNAGRASDADKRLFIEPAPLSAPSLRALPLTPISEHGLAAFLTTDTGAGTADAKTRGDNRVGAMAAAQIPRAPLISSGPGVWFRSSSALRRDAPMVAKAPVSKDNVPADALAESRPAPA